MDQSNDGIVILDIDGHVYDTNRRFREMLGYSVEEIQNLSVWDWEMNYPKEDILEMVKLIDEAGVQIESKHRRKTAVFTM